MISSYRRTMNFGSIRHGSIPADQRLAVLEVLDEVVHGSADAAPTGSPSVRELPGEPTSVAAARAFVRDACVNGTAPLAHDAALLTSELVTNSLRHAKPGAVLVTVTRHGPAAVRVTVSDGGGRTVPCVCRHEDTGACVGRGLLIMRAIAPEWGMRISAAGCEVWFELEAAV